MADPHMTPVQVTPVVAVFGSKIGDTLDPALAVGEAVSRAGCVLLTGGGRTPTQRTVKEQAMNGARNAETHGLRAARVGVLGTESSEVAIQVDGWEVILEPNLGDGRNYVNAAMCDVAIAFPGGHGTDSEVAFALALGRPVVLVGAPWDTSFPRGEERTAREALVLSAKERVKGDDRTALAERVTDAYADLLTAPLRIERCALEHPAGEVVALARRLVQATAPVGDVPTLHDRPDLDELAQEYRVWLTDLRRRRLGETH